MSSFENQTDMQQEFWKTLELLVSRESKRTEKDVMDDVQDWVDHVVSKRRTSKDDEDFNRKKLGSTSSGYGSEDEIQTERLFYPPAIVCNFTHPHVRSRLEKLMGSNMVSLTDRVYMQRLQERILEDFATEMAKRIALRENQEVERVKRLVLTGKLPLDEAPPSMANHPVKLIDLFCQKLIDARRAKIIIPRVRIPNLLYWDDTPDPPSGLSIEKGHRFRKANERLCHHPEPFIAATDKQDIKSGYMFTEEEYTKLFYENPLIKQLRECETVEEMYSLADEILGNVFQEG